MNMKNKGVLLAVSGLLLAGCAGLPSSAELDAMTDNIVKASFRSEGIASVDRLLATDETNRLCSQADAAGKPLDEKTAKRIEEANLKAIKWPADGKFLGDWKQISKEEISFGTLGPSLYNYGKLRGVKDPNDPASRAIVEYTWGKIWNSKAYNACSNMPRAGHAGVLNEAQVRHIVALLLDPNSPVNK
jgi:sulfur-oxidizing protein SoxX